MSRYRLHYVVFLIGLAVLCWVGAGYLGQGGGPLPFLMTLVIAACYVGGAFELHRYRRDSTALAQRVAALQGTPAALDDWLTPLPASLRHAVRGRVEGTRSALPGPALTPYLVGLLVLLGMLGTLLGMVVTLRGTGAAMADAADIDAIRASLGAPIRGLGFAFGTSIAGVAASAMLGLLAAMCRRERLHIVQALDARIAGTLRVFSHTYQREASLALMQRQADVMPTLVTRLETMMTAIEQQHLAAQQRQASQQEAFHAKTERVYLELARSVGESMRLSVAEGAQAASAALQPVAQATFESIGSEMRALQQTVGDAVQQQLAGLTDGFATSTTRVAAVWEAALQAHTDTTTQQALRLQDALSGFSNDFAARTRDMLEALSAHHEASVREAAQAWRDAVTEQARAGEQLAAQQDAALTRAGAAFVDGAQSLLERVDHANGTLRAQLAETESVRLDAWSDRLKVVSDQLHGQWTQTAEETSQRQQTICDALAATAAAISEQSADHARGVIAEIADLASAAAEAPKAAAAVIGEMREQLSESVARDTATLEERARLLDTLQTLLQGVNLAATEQRTAIDTLVGRSSDLLTRIAADFAERVAAESGKLDGIAANINTGALEVAGLGEAMTHAVDRFDAANGTLVGHLERIEGALDKSMARSDEQLGFYVAQAREVIDLSMLSQKQIIENLQHLASERASEGRRATPGAAAA